MADTHPFDELNSLGSWEFTYYGYVVFVGGSMKVEFLKSHTHRGSRYSRGAQIDVQDSDVVKLISRGVAKKFKPAPKKPTHLEIESESNTLIGETDVLATDE